MDVKISMQFFGGRGGASGISAKGGGGGSNYKENFDTEDGTNFRNTNKEYVILEKERVPIKIKYSEYKKDEYKYETVKGSYNAKDKTIDVIQVKGQKANLEQFRKDYKVVNEKVIGDRNFFVIKAKTEYGKSNDNHVVLWMKNNKSEVAGSITIKSAEGNLAESNQVFKKIISKAEKSAKRGKH